MRVGTDLACTDLASEETQTENADAIADKVGDKVAGSMLRKSRGNEIGRTRIVEYAALGTLSFARTVKIAIREDGVGRRVSTFDMARVSLPQSCVLLALFVAKFDVSPKGGPGRWCAA